MYLLLYFYIRFIKNFDKELLNGDNGDIEFPYIVGITTSFAGFIFAILVIFFNFDWLQIMIAPKLWLVEFAAQLTR